jgi:hypothetical protein
MQAWRGSLPQSPTSTTDWIVVATRELLAGQNVDGGWPYHAGGTSSTEPTACAILTLNGIQPGATEATAALTWLAARQLADGAFTISAECPSPSWVTPLAAMSLARNGHVDEATAAANHLLAQDVFVLDPIPADMYGYDTRIPGWPWTSGDYSFTEPTSLAAMFLKQQGHSQHDRVRQAVAALHTRALASGGWNYGEPVVLGSPLYPVAAPTALALLALADEQDAAAAAALTWLAAQLGSLTSLYSLGWAAVAMNVYNRLDDSWTTEVMTRWQATPPQRRNPMDTALCLLALAPRTDHPFAVMSA